MSLIIYRSFCLSVCLSIEWSIHPSVTYLSIYLSTFLPTCTSIHSSIHAYIHEPLNGISYHMTLCCMIWLGWVKGFAASCLLTLIWAQQLHVDELWIRLWTRALRYAKGVGLGLLSPLQPSAAPKAQGWDYYMPANLLLLQVSCPSLWRLSAVLPAEIASGAAEQEWATAFLFS